MIMRSCCALPVALWQYLPGAPPRPPLPCPAPQGLEATLIAHRVRLVVLDSVAALARSGGADFARGGGGGGGLPERQRMLGQQVRASEHSPVCLAYRPTRLVLPASYHSCAGPRTAR